MLKYKMTDRSIKVYFGLCVRGVGMTEVSAWWKGLAKELELDIETLDEVQKDYNKF